MGYIRPKNRDGTWFAPYDYVLSGNKNFCEANAAQYTWFCSHDVQGLANLMGGTQAYVDKLDWHFRMGEPVNFEDGYVSKRLISYSNEPDFHVGHLFNYAGAPWLSQKWIRRVKELAFGNVTTSNAGYCYNDEDQGQGGSLSALMSMGLYSARGLVGNPPTIELTSPIFDRVTIHLDPVYYSGKTFTIVTTNNSEKNMYIQSAKLNGQPWDRCWFPFDVIRRGGTLNMTLGAEPNKAWGVKNPPPSQSPVAPVVQRQLKNAAKHAKASASSESDGQTADKAFDGDGETLWVSKAGAWPQWIAVDLGTEREINLVSVRFGQFTANAYQIQVSLDGTNWKDIVSVADNDRTTPLRIHALHPVKARYVRLFATKGAGTQLSVYEFNVYDVQDVWEEPDNGLKAQPK